MTNMIYTYLFGFLAALFLSLIITPFIRYIAIKLGKVSQVSHDRWHKKPTPFLGGIGIWSSFLFSVILLACISGVWDAPLLKLPVIPYKYLYLTLAGASGMFVLGLIDDFFKLNPQIKLVAQIIIAAVMVKSGIVIEIIHYPVISIPLTIFWIVGLTNAFNLLDNMDGLSAGIAGISSLILFSFSFQSGDQFVAILSIPLAGAAFGFLAYNFYPARIFMGDSGSLFIGFLISIMAIVGTWKHAANLIVTMIPPLLALGIPLFDTMFVTVTRRLRGQSVSQGGKDHISHRLVKLGLSERRTVLVLYSVSILFGASALFFNKTNPFIILAVSAFVAIGLFSLGMVFREFEGDIDGRGNNSIIKGNFSAISAKHPLSKRTIVEILIDVGIISMAYFSSYLIRTEGALPQPFFGRFVESLPWIIIMKLIVFYYMDLYKSHWKYISITDLINIVKTVTISSLIIVVAVFMFTRFSYGYSRAVFIIDWMLTLILIGGSRCIFRAFRELIIDYRIRDKRALIVGAGDAGEFVLREINYNHSLNLKVVGFVDDDLNKLGKRIHGVKVLGTTDDLHHISQKMDVQEVFIAIPSAPREAISRIENICKKNRLKYGIIPMTNSILDKLIQSGSLEMDKEAADRQIAERGN